MINKTVDQKLLLTDCQTVNKALNDEQQQQQQQQSREKASVLIICFCIHLHGDPLEITNQVIQIPLIWAN